MLDATGSTTSLIVPLLWKPVPHDGHRTRPSCRLHEAFDDAHRDPQEVAESLAATAIRTHEAFQNWQQCTTQPGLVSTLS